MWGCRHWKKNSKSWALSSQRSRKHAGGDVDALAPPRGIIDELRAAGLEIRRIDDEAILIRNPGVAETRYAMVKGRARQRGGAFSCLSGPERTALIRSEERRV